MSTKYPAELKLKCLALIASDTPLREITDLQGVSYPTLLKWRKELATSIENKTITDLIDVDEAVVHGVAEHMAEALVELDPTQADAISGELLSVTDSVDGYQALSTELQAVASRLAKKISSKALGDCGVEELESLVTSLAKLQDAFFNKNVTNVAVFANQGGSNNSVSKFKSLQKA